MRKGGFPPSIAKTGKLVDLTTFSPDYLSQYIQSWLDMATKPSADGKPTMVGVWERVNVKSLVWYPKKAFDKAREDQFTGTDESSLVERLEQIEVSVVPGSDRNIKITRPTDMELARLFLTFESASRRPS